MGFLGQVFQEQRIHRPFEPDVQMRDVAFGERDDVDAGEGEALEEPGGIFLVAAEAVQRFGKDDVEAGGSTHPASTPGIPSAAAWRPRSRDR
jgi:hypothetical protein